MNDDLDRVLLDERDVEPSPVFVRSVMAAVERESAGPPPLPFPWLRAAPLVIAALGIVVVILYTAYIAMSSQSAPPPDALLPSAPAPATIWIAIGLLASAASVAVATFRLER